MKATSPKPPTAVSLDNFLRRLILALLLPLAALASLLVAASIYQVHEKRIGEVADWAQHLAMEVDTDLRVRLHGLETIAAWARTQTDASTSVNDWYLHARVYDRTFGTPVVLVDAQRQMLRHSRVEPGRPLPLLPTPAGRSAHQDALTTGVPQIGDPVPGPVLKTQVVPIFVPVLGPAQTLMGLVPTLKFRELLRAHHIPVGWTAALVDSRGQVIAQNAEDVGDEDLFVREARRAEAKTELAPFTVVVVASPWSFYRTHIVLGVALVLSVGLALAVAGLAARRASVGLVAAVRGLIPATAVDTAKHPPEASIIEIEAVRQELQRVSERERSAEWAERERIARELHDGLQQDAAVVRLHLDLVLGRSDLDPQARQSLQRAQASVYKVSQEVQNVVLALRPQRLARAGLVGALQSLVDDFKQFPEPQIELEILGDEEDVLSQLAAPVADAVYRIAQESLNNVRKHAQASFVHVVLDASEPQRLTLIVSDDGVGLSGAQGASGQGLRGMAERAKALGADLSVRRGHHDDHERGTTVTLTLTLGT